MNQIVIEFKNGMFYVYWRYVYTRIRGGKNKEVAVNRLLFVTGRHPGETPQEARILAEEGAIEFREKHPEIGDIKFKSMR